MDKKRINDILDFIQNINSVSSNQSDYVPYPTGPQWCCDCGDCYKAYRIGTCYEQVECRDGKISGFLCPKKDRITGRCILDQRNCSSSIFQKPIMINMEINIPECNLKYIQRVPYISNLALAASEKLTCTHGKPSIQKRHRGNLGIDQTKGCCEKRQYPMIYRSSTGFSGDPVGGYFTDDRKAVDFHTGWTSVQWAMYQSGGYWDVVFSDTEIVRNQNVYVKATLIKDPNFKCPSDPEERALWCQYSPGALDETGLSVCCERTPACKSAPCAVGEFCPPYCFRLKSSVVNPDGTFICDVGKMPLTPTPTPTPTPKEENYLEWAQKAKICPSKKLDKNANCLILSSNEHAVLDQIIKTTYTYKGQKTIIDFITYKKENKLICPSILESRPTCNYGTAYVADWGPMINPTCCLPIWKCPQNTTSVSDNQRVSFCFNQLKNLINSNPFISPVFTPPPNTGGAEGGNKSPKEKSLLNLKTYGYFYKLEITSKVWENKFQSVHSFIDLELSGLKEEEVYYDEKNKCAYIMYPSRKKTYYIKSGVSVLPGVGGICDSECISVTLDPCATGKICRKTNPHHIHVGGGVRGEIWPDAFGGAAVRKAYKRYPENWPGPHKISIDKTTKNLFLGRGCIEIEIRNSEITNLWSKAESVGIINIKATVGGCYRTTGDTGKLTFKNLDPSTGAFNIELSGSLNGQKGGDPGQGCRKQSDIFGLEGLNILSLKLNKVRLNGIILKKAPRELGLHGVEGSLTIAPDKPSLVNLLYLNSYENESLDWPWNQKQNYIDWPRIVTSNPDHGFTLNINNNCCFQYNSELNTNTFWESHLHAPQVGSYYLNNAETNKNVLKGINNTVNLMPGISAILSKSLHNTNAPQIRLNSNIENFIISGIGKPDKSNDLIDFINKINFGDLNLSYREWPMFIIGELFIILRNSFSVNKNSEISAILTNLKRKLNATVMLGWYNLTKINEHIPTPPLLPPRPPPPLLPPPTPTSTNIIQTGVLCPDYSFGSSGRTIGVLDLDNDSLWAQKYGFGSSAESSRPDYYDTVYVFEASSTGFITTLSFAHRWEEEISQKYGLATLQIYSGSGISGPLLFQSRIIIQSGDNTPLENKYTNYNVNVPCVAKNKYSVRLNYESAKSIPVPLSIIGWAHPFHSKFFEYYTYTRNVRTLQKIAYTPDFRVYISKNSSPIKLCKEPTLIYKGDFIQGQIPIEFAPINVGRPVILPPKNPVIPPPKNPNCHPTQYDTVVYNHRAPVNYFPEGCLDPSLPSIIGWIRIWGDKKEYPIVNPEFKNYAAVLQKHRKVYKPTTYPQHISLEDLVKP
jgi:hypothetical protein